MLIPNVCQSKNKATTICRGALMKGFEKKNKKLKTHAQWLSEGTGKGQLISKCPFGVTKSTKKPKKFLQGFLP